MDGLDKLGLKYNFQERVQGVQVRTLVKQIDLIFEMQKELEE